MIHSIHALLEFRHAQRADTSGRKGGRTSFGRITQFSLVIFGCSAQIGCGKVPDPGINPSVTLSTASVIEERASISGRVSLIGGRPASMGKTIDVGANAYCSSHGQITDPTWQVSDNGALGGVVVSVRDSGRASNIEAAPVLIDQVSCLYQPNITVLQPGQTALIRNSDETFHNVRIIRHDASLKTPGTNLSNLGQPTKGSSDLQTFNEPGIYRLECDVHRWMKSWVYVHTGIHVATSRSDGSFALNRALPDGTYVVEAWHPCFVKPLTNTVRVVGGVGTTDFQFNLADAAQH